MCNIHFISLFFYLIACISFDLKCRKIPNIIQVTYFVYTFFLLYIESENYFSIVIWFFMLRSLIFGLALLLAIILFSLRLIGGGDGKVLILIFHSIPLHYIFSFSIWFFLTLGIAVLLIVLYSYITNKEGYSIFAKFSFFYATMNSSDKTDSTMLLRSFKKKFVAPLTVPIFFSYILVMILILFKFL